jgi:hypothetical protein
LTFAGDPLSNADFYGLLALDQLFEPRQQRFYVSPGDVAPALRDRVVDTVARDTVAGSDEV